MRIVGCLSHESDNLKTPKVLFDYFISNLGCIDTFEYCSSYDQYEKMYYGKRLFMNPPYSHLRSEKFRKYLLELLDNNNTIFLLIPSRTDTRLFSLLLNLSESICFIKGRLHFNESKCAPFPSVIFKLSYLSLNLSYPILMNYDVFTIINKDIYLS